MVFSNCSREVSGPRVFGRLEPTITATDGMASRTRDEAEKPERVNEKLVSPMCALPES
jgi:hypothetical protein